MVLPMPHNYSNYLVDFIVDTGLDPKTNVDTYIQYYQARLLDAMLQQQLTKMNELISKVDEID